MTKKILIAGASGMIGSEILAQALSATSITEVRLLVRHPMSIQHAKIKEFVVNDFAHYSQGNHFFEDIDVAYFCIGVYTGQVPDPQFKAITVDYALAFAKQLQQQSPNAHLCFLSGAGADRTEQSKTAFARYKGMAENKIDALNLHFHSFRPGYIYPVTPRKEPNMMYSMMRMAYPLLKLLGNKYSITSHDLARAIFLVGLQGHEQEILENIDIIHFLNQPK